MVNIPWRRIESSPPQGSELNWALELLNCYFRDVDSGTYDPAADVTYINDRFSHEGLAFVTKELPRLGASILNGFRTGIFMCPLGFVRFRTPRWAALPKFLSILLKRVFCGFSGVLHSVPDPEAVKILHQICSMFKKLEAEMDDELVDQHYKEMLDFDASLPGNLDNVTPRAKKVVCTASNVLSKVLRGLDLREITPKHGSGAVSTPGIFSYEKQHLDIVYSLYTARLNGDYKWFDYFFTRWHNLAIVPVVGQIPIPFKNRRENTNAQRGSDDWIQYPGHYYTGVRLHAEPAAYYKWWREACCTRTLCVPKSVGKLRVISAEPVPNMAIQLGQQKALVAHISSNKITMGHVNFRTQNINRELALAASLKNDFATLDLKSASDSVTVAMVSALFPYDILKLLFASRTAFTQIKWKQTGYLSYRKLTKFAPMGFGVCFPVESLVFWALAVGVIYLRRKQDLKNKRISVSMSGCARLAYTYGDDLIVPVEYADDVTATFAELGLIVNVNKSFITGPFRESCGCDAFAGIEVTPVKVKIAPPEEITDGSNAAAWNDYAANFHERGLSNCAEFCYKRLEKVFGSLPFRFPESLYLGRVGEACDVIPKWVPVSGPFVPLNKYAASVLSRERTIRLAPYETDDAGKDITVLRDQRSGKAYGKHECWTDRDGNMTPATLEMHPTQRELDNRRFNSNKRSYKIKAWVITNKPVPVGHSGADGLWRWFSSMKHSGQDSLEFTDPSSKSISYKKVEVCRW